MILDYHLVHFFVAKIFLIEDYTSDKRYPQIEYILNIFLLYYFQYNKIQKILLIFHHLFLNLNQFE